MALRSLTLCLALLLQAPAAPLQAWDLSGHGGPVRALAVLEGRLAAAWDGTVRLWHLATREARVLPGHQGNVNAVAFAAGALHSTGQDGTLRRWEATNAQPLGPLAAEVWRACQACHALRPDAGAMAGPHLHRLFRRRMGGAPGYAHSERLARGDITWTAETVADLFTRGPDVVTPGRRMPVRTVGNSEDMAARIRFLERATR